MCGRFSSGYLNDFHTRSLRSHRFSLSRQKPEATRNTAHNDGWVSGGVSPCKTQVSLQIREITGEARGASCKASHIGLRDGAVTATRLRLLPHGFEFILVWSDAFCRGLAGFVLLVFGSPDSPCLGSLKQPELPALNLLDSFFGCGFQADTKGVFSPCPLSQGELLAAYSARAIRLAKSRPCAAGSTMLCVRATPLDTLCRPHMFKR